MVPDCPLGCMSSADGFNSIDVNTNGGLDLDRGGIPELKPKPKAIEKDFGKKLNTIYEHGSDGAGDGEGHAGKKNCSRSQVIPSLVDGAASNDADDGGSRGIRVNCQDREDREDGVEVIGDKNVQNEKVEDEKFEDEKVGEIKIDQMKTV